MGGIAGTVGMCTTLNISSKFSRLIVERKFTTLIYIINGEFQILKVPSCHESRLNHPQTLFSIDLLQTGWLYACTPWFRKETCIV